MSEKTTRVYELGFLLVPTIAEDMVQATVAALVASLVSHGGVVIAQGAPEYIDLAYSMQQRLASKLTTWDQAYFGWVKFELDPEATDALKKTLDLDPSLIRYLLIKTNPENTITFRAPKREAKRGQGVLEDADGMIDEVALEAETAALEETEKLEEPAPLVHETLPDLSADIAETESE